MIDPFAMGGGARTWLATPDAHAWRRRFLPRVAPAGVAVSHEGGAAVAPYRWMEGGFGKGHFRAQADIRYLSGVAQVHHALA